MRYGMPTSASRKSPLLVDTSVAVALVVEDHEDHEVVLDALRGRTLGLAGHAFFETYSVLTRLPGSARRAPSEVVRILEHNFPHTRFLAAERSRKLSLRLAGLGIAGGAVYDALVGETAIQHQLELATRDHRAIPTYRLLDVAVHLVG